jgi:DNA-binding SARP family transcriptional activator
MLRIFLFGHLHVHIDGIPLRLTAPPKTIPLWAYLLLNRSSPIPRDTLAYTLWPDESEATARANLRRHLHQLHRMLPDAPEDRPWLIIDAEIIQWNPQADAWLDVAEFERLSSSEETLARAVRIYVNDLLEDIDEDWLSFERDRLRNLFFNDLTRLIRSSREHGDYVQAIAYAERLLVHDPLREGAVRQTMSLQYESGNRAGALAEYARFERLLRQKLDVEPMPETRALYETILRNAPLPDAAHPGAKQSNRNQKPVRLPFVGRESELSILNKYWTRTVRQEGSVVLISGENGIGKSRLTTKIAQSAEASGGRVLRGSTTFTEPLPFQAFSEALRSALPFLETLDIEPDFLAAITPLVPELRIRRQDLSTRVPLNREDVIKRLFDSLAHCLEALARPHPLLLILENMHWAKKSSIHLLEYLSQHIPRSPILILVTYRDDEKYRQQPIKLMRRRLQRERFLAHITLKPLSEDEIRELIVQVYGFDAAKTELPQRLIYLSHGNPLFLNEILRDWSESGTIASNTEHRHPADAAIRFPELPAGPLPSIQATISRRLARLNSFSRALAEIGAVIGTAFDLDLIREVAGWSESQILEAIDELMDRHLLHETGSHSGYDFEFSHPMIQASLYNEIPASIRKYRHHRVAYLMQIIYANRLDHLSGELAHHFEAAGEFQSAAEYYLKTAKQSLELKAQDQALSLLQHALKLECEPQTRFNLLALQDTILAKRGDQ